MWKCDKVMWTQKKKTQSRLSEGELLRRGITYATPSMEGESERPGEGRGLTVPVLEGPFKQKGWNVPLPLDVKKHVGWTASSEGLRTRELLSGERWGWKGKKQADHEGLEEQECGLHLGAPGRCSHDT